MHIFILKKHMHLEIADGCICLGILRNMFCFSVCCLFPIFCFNSKHFLAVYIRVSAYQSITSANDTTGVIRNN